MKKEMLNEIQENLTDIGHTYYDEWKLTGSRKNATTSYCYSKNKTGSRYFNN